MLTHTCQNIICRTNFTLDQISNQRLLWSRDKLTTMRSFTNKCLSKITGDMLPLLKSLRETRMPQRDSTTHLTLTAPQRLIFTEAELHKQTITSILVDSQPTITITQITKTERSNTLTQFHFNYLKLTFINYMWLNTKFIIILKP